MSDDHTEFPWYWKYQSLCIVLAVTNVKVLMFKENQRIENKGALEGLGHLEF